MDLKGTEFQIRVWKAIKNIPKGRMMDTKDLYGIIDYLCSDKNTYMNGSTLVLDGGYTSW